MKNNKLQNGIEEIKKITMTADEKKQVFENILNSSPVMKKPIHSPWMTFSFISQINKKQLAYFVIIPLIFILSGGGVVFASEESLPDSILYPIKVNIVEPVKGAFIFSPEAKAKYEIDLATERLVEVETLADQGKLDKIDDKKINNLLENHTKSLNRIIDKINKTESKDKADKIVNDFKTKMNAHVRGLEIIKKDNQNQKQDQDQEKNNRKEKRNR